ncbi:hypothetical protein EG68_01153 [Paragonimus skrjabini miyazakii]|uniref:Uncharacterized protein n=1 Tax=Paragonimus skrjabini miyazakii TaxID=59628 RepID=A0A8S9Z239_9TREM|nr:hypothetical protein EG68_01153 [Paragonimus skrjabini miyazakii]
MSRLQKTKYSSEVLICSNPNQSVVDEQNTESVKTSCTGRFTLSATKSHRSQVSIKVETPTVRIRWSDAVSPALSEFTPTSSHGNRRTPANHRFCSSIVALKEKIADELEHKFTVDRLCNANECWGKYLFCTYVDLHGNKLSFF